MWTQPYFWNFEWHWIISIMTISWPVSEAIIYETLVSICLSNYLLEPWTFSWNLCYVYTNYIRLFWLVKSQFIEANVQVAHMEPASVSKIKVSLMFWVCPYPDPLSYIYIYRYRINPIEMPFIMQWLNNVLFCFFVYFLCYYIQWYPRIFSELIHLLDWS